MRRSLSEPFASIVKAVYRAPAVSPTISVRPSGVITEPFGNSISSAATAAVPSGSMRIRLAVDGIGAGHEVEAELTGVRAAGAVDDHVVEVPAAVLADVGVHGRSRPAP